MQVMYTLAKVVPSQWFCTRLMCPYLLSRRSKKSNFDFSLSYDAGWNLISWNPGRTYSKCAETANMISVCAYDIVDVIMTFMHTSPRLSAWRIMRQHGFGRVFVVPHKILINMKISIEIETKFWAHALQLYPGVLHLRWNLASLRTLKYKI